MRCLFNPVKVKASSVAELVAYLRDNPDKAGRRHAGHRDHIPI